jgi:hypothetical protein
LIGCAETPRASGIGAQPPPQTLRRRHYSFAALQNTGVFVAAVCFSREPRHDTNESRQKTLGEVK